MTDKALSTYYNGLDIVHDRDYINIHVTPYIDKIIENHGWGEEGKPETRMIKQLHPSSIK